MAESCFCTSIDSFLSPESFGGPGGDELSPPAGVRGEQSRKKAAASFYRECWVGIELIPHKPGGRFFNGQELFGRKYYPREKSVLKLDMFMRELLTTSYLSPAN